MTGGYIHQKSKYCKIFMCELKIPYGENRVRGMKDMKQDM
jgi:hypothetical protein